MRFVVGLCALGLVGCGTTVAHEGATTGGGGGGTTSSVGGTGGNDGSGGHSADGGAGASADSAWSMSFGHKGETTSATLPLPDADLTAHFEVAEWDGSGPMTVVDERFDAVDRGGTVVAHQPNPDQLGEPIPSADGGFVHRGRAAAGTSMVAGLPLACDAACWFVLKTDASGHGVWVTSLSDGGAYLVAPAPDGSVRVAGFFSGSLQLGAESVTSVSDNDTFVASLDPDGQPLWLRSFASGAGDTANMPHTIAVDPAGDVAVSGRFRGTLELGDGTTASSDTTGDGGDGGFVAKLDPSGATAVIKAYGGQGNGVPYPATTLLGDGSIVVAGCFEGTFDFGGGPVSTGSSRAGWVVGLGPAGEYRWTQALGACPSWPPFPALADAGNGRLWVGWQLSAPTTIGGVQLTPHATTDALLLELDALGQVVATRQFGVAGNQWFTGAYAAKDGSLFLSGGFDHAIDFGQGKLTAIGTTGAFAARIFP